jgi:16S rRNA (cytidine1402-2'-O)-methyltransferase
MPQLYLVPTPIGNLEDITLRGLRILREADFILAEDTRTSSVLLHHFEITRPMRPFHAHNEHHKLEEIISLIEQSNSVALISDAGTPGISDPGFLLVRACVERQIKVTCLPGATAFVPALVGSGFPCNEFSFYGFLPQKKGRQSKWKEISADSKTIILYESPFRLMKLLEEIKEFFGPQREISVARELTKLHEEISRGSVEEVINFYSKKNAIKGELVIIIKGN